jgi:ribosomal protein L11 methyltransferase
VPYRIDIPAAGEGALDRLIELGALDVDAADGGALAALMPDEVGPDRVAQALGLETIATSPAIGRDEDSVWLLRPRRFRAGRLAFAPARADERADAGVVRLIDTPVFGTGLHPTTALCLEALEDLVSFAAPDAVLDAGTGSGILALAALALGVPRVTAIDIDAEAVRVAAENARINGVAARLRAVHGGVDAVDGSFPLVLANILAAPLIEMAPLLARRVGHHGRVVLSGIPSGVEADVDRAYRRLGMRSVSASTRAGWIALVYQATW